MKHFDDIMQHLEETQRFREQIHTESRRIIADCSRIIIQIHQGQYKEAQDMLHNTKSSLIKLQDIATSRDIVTVEQEYTEAHTLYNIVNHDRVPLPEQIGVAPEAYILGMLDTIGELKRFMLNCIRNDNLDTAYHTFDTMETLYECLYPFAAYNTILKESKRKLDVCRITLESSRAIVTEERRRQHLISRMRAMGFEPTNS
ncbi:MAG: RNA-binding protein [Cenarchaeum sp. SB0665_bin_23]|nr:RNA-binding protein [Cenarchaeum sp. SB0664_bin_35]MXY60524.1 RNA-binding protein [Cenarchaeum sp. SB0665_bin_23]MXZ93999.1 RNA-binding protein [Cenarchaeum sp. SB0666_bin_15]MYB46210.1 RNA-binding protein [Cenarchaeum sp. SB0662_bin_33]MYD58217.1 RNA-binding protein [Cenarchaeum sp. SB0678_bin_8]MYG32444.1 RNA-binding protein [Cenarchaeum sp. SB0677_bin_16]